MSQSKSCKLFDLKEGDRFYFDTDRSRHVWQVVLMETGIIEPWHQAAYESLVYHVMDDNKVRREVKGNRRVQFIRHKD